MTERARLLDLGHQTTITPKAVKTPTSVGWVARITGTHPKYELARTFLEHKTSGPPVDGRPKWRFTYRLPGNGLYEFRKIGNGSLAGFFVVSGVFKRRVRLVDRDTAFALARRR